MNWGVYGVPKREKQRTDYRIYSRMYNRDLPYWEEFLVWYSADMCYTDDTMQTLCGESEAIGFIPDKSGYERHFYAGSGDVKHITDNGFSSIFVEDGYLITRTSFSLEMQIVVFRSVNSKWSWYNVAFSQHGSYTNCRHYLFAANSAGGWHVAPSTVQYKNGVIQNLGSSLAPIEYPMVGAFGHRFPTTIAPWVSGWDHNSNSRNMIIYEIIGLPILSNEKLIDIQEALMTRYNIS